jgi:hypothetical protein
MNKQFQGSKKKARKAGYLKRQAARIQKLGRNDKLVGGGNIEEMAEAMGIKLK